MRPRSLVTVSTLVASLLAPGARASDAPAPFAAPAAPGLLPSGLGSLASVTVALALVLGAIFALAWLLRRLRAGSSHGADALQVIADVRLGLKERAVLLRVGRAQVLVGVAPGRVTTLHTLEATAVDPAPELSAPAGVGAPSFRELLRKGLGRP